MKWHDYAEEDPPDEMVDKILRVRVTSVSCPGHRYEERGPR